MHDFHNYIGKVWKENVHRMYKIVSTSKVFVEIMKVFK